MTNMVANRNKNLVSLVYPNVLVGMELDEPDKQMMVLLKKFSKVFGMEHLSFVHVLPRIERTDPFAMVYTADSFHLDPESMSQLTAAIKSKVEEIIAPTVFKEMTYYAAQGSVLHQLVNFTNDKMADLVVVGRNRGKRHAIKSKNLIRQVAADLLVLPEGTTATTGKIMVAIDFSAHSIRALQCGVTLSKKVDAELFAINVYQRPNLMASQLEMSIEQFEKNIAANHHEGFNQFVDKHFAGEKDRIKPILVQSDYPKVAREILEQGRRIGADFMIAGAKGHSKLARLLLGSTSERLLDLNDELPFLVVK